MRVWGREFSRLQIASGLLAIAVVSVGYAGDFDYLCDKLGGTSETCGTVPILGWASTNSTWVLPALLYLAIVVYIWGERRVLDRQYATSKRLSQIDSMVATIDSTLEEQAKRITSAEVAANNLNKQVDGHAHWIGNLFDQLVVKETEKAVIKLMEPRINSLQQDMTAHERNQQALGELYGELNSKLSELEQRLDENSPRLPE